MTSELEAYQDEVDDTEVEFEAEVEAEAELTDVPAPGDNQSMDPLQLFLREVAKYDLLTAKQEVILAKRKDLGDVTRPPCCSLCLSAADALMNHNLRMVISVANYYHRGKSNAGMGYLDLIQEGMLGLIRAVEKYDCTKLSDKGTPYRFSTYALWWVRQSVAKGLGEKSRNIRVPMHVIDKLTKISAARKQLHTEFGYEPSVAELGEHLGMSTDLLIEVMSSTEVPLSLNEGGSGSDTGGDSPESELQAALSDATTPSPHEIVAQGIDAEVLRTALGKLHPRTLDILEKRFGLGGSPVMSLTDIGMVWGITYQRVRQIELKILESLQQSPDLQILREDTDGF